MSICHYTWHVLKQQMKYIVFKYVFEYIVSSKTFKHVIQHIHNSFEYEHIYRELSNGIIMCPNDKRMTVYNKKLNHITH